MLITVFTPTYNRAQLLTRLYESLRRQTFTDFEWLIVDDGSTDNTKDVVDSFMAQSGGSLLIRYIHKSNGGKHTAINLGAHEAQGELFFIADSDDALPEDALETTAKAYREIQGDKSFAGICGLDITLDGVIIGGGLGEDYIDATAIDIRFKRNIQGDLKEVFRTEVLREFPFPEITGERFCPEALVWNRIATKYKLRYINKPIYIAEYQTGGLTDNIVRIRMQSPVASMMTYAEMAGFAGVPFKARLRAAINYWRFRACLGEGSAAPLPHLPLRWMWTRPIGMLMHLRDKKAIR